MQKQLGCMCRSPNKDVATLNSTPLCQPWLHLNTRVLWGKAFGAVSEKGDLDFDARLGEEAKYFGQGYLWKVGNVMPSSM